MTAYRTVLLDLDGTVIDSVGLIRESHRHAVRTVLGQDLADELYRVYREWNHANTAALLRPYPGIEEVLADLRDAGCRLGIVTSKSSDAVELAWRTVPLRHYFDVVVAAEDTDRHKPDPTPVLHGLESLGGGAHRACYVGDSPFDLRAGIAAGVATIGVTWGFFSRAELEAERPDLVVDTADELRAACLGG